MQEEGQLCAKKQIIFDKFNELLAKLGHENVERNASEQVTPMLSLISILSLIFHTAYEAGTS